MPPPLPARERPWLNPGFIVGAAVTLALVLWGALPLLRPATATLRTNGPYDGRTFPCGAPAWHTYPSSISVDGGTFGAQPGEPGYEELRSSMCSWEVNRRRSDGLVRLALGAAAAAATLTFHVLPRRRVRAGRADTRGGAVRTAWLGAASALASLYGWYAAYSPGADNDAAGVFVGLGLAVLTIWSWVAADRRDKRRVVALAAVVAAVAVVGYVVLVTVGAAPPPHHISN